jgi:hypothetical protein
VVVSASSSIKNTISIAGCIAHTRPFVSNTLFLSSTKAYQEIIRPGTHKLLLTYLPSSLSPSSILVTCPHRHPTGPLIASPLISIPLPPTPATYLRPKSPSTLVPSPSPLTSTCRISIYANANLHGHAHTHAHEGCPPSAQERISHQCLNPAI